MSGLEERKVCHRCGQENMGQHCSSCGHPFAVQKINGQYLLSELSSVFNLEKGFLLTIKEVFLRPRKSIRTFINHDRKSLVKPIIFLIVCSLVYMIAQQSIGFEDGYVNYSFGKNSRTQKIFNWISENYGYSNIMISFFIALWIKLLFQRPKQNYFEVLVVLFYIIGVGMLIFTVFGIIDSLIPLKIIDKGYFLGIVYIAWAIGQFFDGNKIFNTFKGFLCYMLGLITFTLFVLGIGKGIDFFLN